MIWKRKANHEETVPQPRKVCPLCLRIYTDDSLFCKVDGQKLQLDEPAKTEGSERIICPNCGFRMTAIRSRCPVCGHVFSKVKPEEVSAFFNLIPESGLPIRIAYFPYTFGRKDVIRHRFSEYVNTEHLVFTKDSTHFYIREKKSLNGSSLNGHAIGGKRFESLKKLQLADGDEIGLALDKNMTPLIRFRVELPQAQTTAQINAASRKGTR